MDKKEKLVHQIFQSSRMMSHILNQRIATYDLTHAQLAIIEYLSLQPTSLVDIAKYLSVEKSTVTRAVKNLEKNGFVKHIPSQDNREKRIILSNYSLMIQDDIQLTKNKFESDAFKNIPSEELETTYQTLLKIMNNFTGAES